ncbi:MAG: trypsin-like peptidase domain-containing protein [Actinomycetota bacterium]|nr:trypsin-like peptidase domain-containing protein [Actinomycetota bacterium]
MNNGDTTPPPYPPGYPLSPPPARPGRGGRVVGSALLVGALAGGAAGFSGAALLHETTSHNAATLSRRDTSGLTVAPDTSGSSSPNALDASAETAAANVLPSVVKIYGTSATQSGSGSGIVLTRTGQILTNNHVAELGINGGRLAVSFPNGRTTSATILGRDPLTDLAVIQAKGVTDAKPATLGRSADLQVGQPVVAVGAPFGLESTVTSGIVSALNRPVTTQGELANDPSTIFPAIQTDAAINPGNSGGPLVDASGQVVGINSAIRTATSRESGGQAGSIGLGFAIPIDEAIPIVQQLRNHETPTHARIGVTVTDATDTYGLPDGALVRTVEQNTPAAQVGLRPGDVITKLNGTGVTDSDSLVADVRSYRPGDQVTLTVRAKSGTIRSVDVTLGSD